MTGSVMVTTADGGVFLYTGCRPDGVASWLYVIPKGQGWKPVTPPKRFLRFLGVPPSSKKRKSRCE